MNRKIHNSLNAAMACSVLLTLAVLAGTPIAQPVPLAMATAALPSSAQASTTVAIATIAQPAAAIAANSERRASRRSQQSVRMPFFSFFLPQD